MSIHITIRRMCSLNMKFFRQIIGHYIQLRIRFLNVYARYPHTLALHWLMWPWLGFLLKYLPIISYSQYNNKEAIWRWNLRGDKDMADSATRLNVVYPVMKIKEERRSCVFIHCTFVTAYLRFTPRELITLAYELM